VPVLAVHLMFVCIWQSDSSAESSTVHDDLMQTVLVLPGRIMFLEEIQDMR